MRIGPYPVTRGEISGAFADLGVLVPLEAALIAINGLNPTTTLLGIGVIYIAAGWYFRIPMPVQPLKAFSAIAIATQVDSPVIAAGALTLGVIMAILALTRAVDLLSKVPPPVIRGIQFGLGLLLIRNGIDLIAGQRFLLDGGPVAAEAGGQAIPPGVLVGGVAVLLLATLVRWPLLPASIVVLGLGLAVGLYVAPEHLVEVLRLGPAAPTIALPEPRDFSAAFLLLVVPQLPLSLANSVVSTVDVARAYFGDQASRVTPRNVALAYALGNIWAGLSGGLPNCHGAGGLTAHYRLGARTPAASVIVGTTLVAVALLWGQSASAARALVPLAVFGALLLYVGWEHLLLGLKVTEKKDLIHVLIAGAASHVTGGNLAVGAGVALLSYALARSWVGRPQQAHRPVPER